MQVESKLAGVIANQIGRLEGVLITQIEEELFNQSERFTNQCPSVEGLIGVAEKRNNLYDVVNSFEKRIKIFEKIPDRLLNVVGPLKALLTILRNLPIPTAVPPGIGIPVSVTNRYAELIYNLLEFSRNLEKDAQAVKAIIDSIGPILGSVKDRFKNLDNDILDCVKELPQGDKERVLKVVGVQDSEESVNTDTVKLQEAYRSESGKDYTLKVIQESSEVDGVKLRRAIGLNNRGVVVIRGESSYSSTPGILIDELKFRIEQLR